MQVQSPQSFHEFAGEDVLLQFTATDEDGDVVNITGYTISAAVAREESDTAVLSTSGATITASLSDPTNGVFTIAFSDTNTDDLLGTYRFQIKLTDGSGGEATVSHGYITFKAKMV